MVSLTANAVLAVAEKQGRKKIMFRAVNLTATSTSILGQTDFPAQPA
jgi:hypothetical protein